MEDILVDDITEIHYKYEDENPRKYSEDGQMKFLNKTLNSIDAET